MARRVEQHYGAYIIGRELVECDYDYPYYAQSLRWNLRRVQQRHGETVHLASTRKGKQNCDHRGTDGTVKCPDCGVTASSFIRYAAEYLDSKC